MKVSLVTTCRSRRAHIEQTLPRNLAALASKSNIVLIDYGSPDRLDEYVTRSHAADLDRGKLVYYQMKDRPSFHMAHAKNVAHRCGMMEGADVLVNVDADNFTGNGFVDWVKGKFEAANDDSAAIFLGARKNHRGPGDLASVMTPKGCFGRIACSTQAFRHAGGYDEIFEHWSPDDKDYANRLSNLGYSWHAIRPSFLSALQHGARSKTKHELRRRGLLDGADYYGWALEERSDFGVVNAGRIGLGTVYRNFSRHPIDIGPIPTRVFGIGLHRTGTTSLALAFRKLGFDSAHWVSPHWARYIYDEMKTLGRSPTLEMHYAICDLPIPLFWRELDRAYPGSKFVLTVRDEGDWIESIKTHWRLRPEWDHNPFTNVAHRELYGTTEFDEAVFRERFRRHNSEVITYFAGRDDLLVVNPAKARMAQLCNFFGLPAYDAPFPHRHKSAEQEKYRR